MPQLTVKATRKGYYGHRVIKEGQKFVIRAEGELGSWMEPIGWTPKERKAAPPTAAAKQTTAAKAGKAKGDPRTLSEAQAKMPGIMPEPKGLVPETTEADMVQTMAEAEELEHGEDAAGSAEAGPTGDQEVI